jgi:hypothetical protein
VSQLGLAPVPISVTPSSGIGTNAKNLRGSSRDIGDRMSHTREPRTGAYFEITPQRNNSSRPPLRRRTIDYLDQSAIDYRDHSHGWESECSVVAVKRGNGPSQTLWSEGGTV